MRGKRDAPPKRKENLKTMRTIAIMNLKGGVAKTVTAVNLAANLATLHEKRVLVIDADSQANSTEFFGVSAEDGSLTTLLRLEDRSRENLIRTADRIIQPTDLPRLRVLPADAGLMALDLSMVQSRSVYSACLRDLLRDELSQGWDFVLIDCPPAFNAAAAAALLAADEVLIPIKLDAFSLRGMGNLMEQIKNMQQINPELRILGLLPTMWYSSEEIKAAERILRDSGLPVLPHIRRSAMVDGMTFKQAPLIRCSPKSGACRDYKLLASRIVLEGGAVNG